jgi:hypothetical protein
MVRGKFFINFLVRQIFFQCFLVRKLKKFGKHWVRGIAFSMAQSDPIKRRPLYLDVNGHSLVFWRFAIIECQYVHITVTFYFIHFANFYPFRE